MYHVEKAEIQSQLKQKGIDPEHIKALHIQLQTGELDQSSFVIDSKQLRAPSQKDVEYYTQLNHAQYTQLGEAALQADELLVFWLNGGAATRYFDDSKITATEHARYKKYLSDITEERKNSPKGITPVVKGMSYLELKIRNLLRITKLYKLEVHPRVMLMNSFITDTKTREHLNTLLKKYPDLDPNRIHFIVQQPTIPRFARVEDIQNIDLFITKTGQLSFAPCGHGDFVYLLQDYFSQHSIPNVRYMFFANIDNVGATIDPMLLGYHIRHQQGRTVELAQKMSGDQGGAPCYVDNKLMIVEQMKFPPSFDQSTIPWFNTNNFWFTIQDLLNFNETLPFVLAEKTISEGNVIQIERFACDVHLPSRYLVIERNQRFWPIKRYVDALLYQDPAADSETYTYFKNLLESSY